MTYRTHCVGILHLNLDYLPRRKLCIFGIMETSTKPSNSHVGRKISRIRELRGIKQETLATELGVSQQSISRMEQSEVLEDEILEKIAKILGVTTEAIKNFSEEAVVNFFNTFNDHSVNQGAVGSNNYHCNFNPLDKIIELVEENKKLYERLLQAEKEKK
jgi:transcriptional regulator with XRE-family HTH domain